MIADTITMSTEQDRVATIDHQEVHVNLTKPTESKPAISQGQIVTSQPNASYKSGETGIVFQPPPDPKDKPKDYVVTSCGVLLLCNFIFGFLGYHFGGETKLLFHYLIPTKVTIYFKCLYRDIFDYFEYIRL